MQLLLVKLLLRRQRVEVLLGVLLRWLQVRLRCQSVELSLECGDLSHQMRNVLVCCWRSASAVCGLLAPAPGI